MQSRINKTNCLTNITIWVPACHLYIQTKPKQDPLSAPEEHRRRRRTSTPLHHHHHHHPKLSTWTVGFKNSSPQSKPNTSLPKTPTISSATPRICPLAPQSPPSPATRSSNPTRFTSSSHSLTSINLSHCRISVLSP